MSRSSQSQTRRPVAAKRMGIRTGTITLVALCLAAALTLEAQRQNPDNGFGKPPVPPVDGANALVAPGERPTPPPQSPVTYDGFSLKIDGRRVILTSGEFHYWRLPAPDLWKRVFERMRAAGMNTVSIYLNWAYHSPAPGIYDFGGVRDLDRVLREAQEAGLYVIVRAGPCVYGETNASGWPGWLLGTTATLRSLDPAFLTAVQQWYSAVLPIVVRHQLHKGGSVILVQLDNELVNGDPAYLTALYRLARRHGIELPLVHNPAYSVGPYGAAVDFEVVDSYPGGLDCARPWTMKDFAGTEKFEADFRAKTGNTPVPLMIAELQGGGMDNYGGPGYKACYESFGPVFVDAATRLYLSQGATALNWYMFYGGTSWGYLPDSLTYTSYDYGAAIHEYLGIGTKYLATKRNMQFMRAVESELAATAVDAAVATASNPALLLNARTNRESGASFVFLRNPDDSQPQTTALELHAASAGPRRVPHQGTIELAPRETRVLIANYPAPWGRVVSTTSQLVTTARQGGQETWVFYGGRGTAGETRLELPGVSAAESSPGVNVSGTGPERRVSYVHGAEPAYARFTIPHLSLLLIFVDDDSAGLFWRFPFAGGDALALSSAFIGMPDSRGAVRIEAHGRQMLTLYGGSLPKSLRLNGDAVHADRIPVAGAMKFDVDGSLALTAAPAPVELRNWRFRAEPFEGAPGYDDSRWAMVDRYRSLSPDVHDYHYGFVWMRGRFVATGKEQAVQVSAHECYGLWINGQFLGAGSWVTAEYSSRKPDPESRQFAVPPGLLKPGQENLVALLSEDPGGYRSAPSIDFLAEDAKTKLEIPIAWKLLGADAALRRGLLSPMNASGLYGERNGWFQSEFKDDGPDWQTVATPHAFRAPDAWIGWYRTTFELHLPTNLDAPMALVLDRAIEGADKLVLFVNGYMMGRYWPERGPQTRFFLPAGVLHTDGKNTLAVAVWRRSEATGGLGLVRLEPYESSAVSVLRGE